MNLPPKPMTVALRDRRQSLVQLAQVGAASLVLWLGPAQLAHGARIVAVRLWPARDYTRITIESDVPLSASQVVVQDPPRMAVDIEGMVLSPELKELVGKVSSTDPQIAGIRIGQNTPTVVRLVIDIKQAFTAQTFSLPPIDQYRYRLVMDIRPEVAPDPLEQLIQNKLQSNAKPSDPLEDWIAAQNQRPPSPGTAPKDKPKPDTKPQSQTQTQPQAPTERLVLVALDPGHGGEDPGAIGPSGTQEKNVVLSIAKRLQDTLNQAPPVGPYRIRAFLTRDGDFFIPLHQRVQKARRAQADLFVSIHADAFFTPKASGGSVYVLSEGAASSASARWMAQKENRSDQVGGLPMTVRDEGVQRALLDMSTSAQIKDSKSLGQALLTEMKQLVRLHKPQVEQAGFAVLRAPDMPSVLIETAFISNPQEEEKLKDPEFQQDMAESLARAIQSYFKRNPPLRRRANT
jgi:N-acetylmuramoyl-L-alanine amidase